MTTYVLYHADSDGRFAGWCAHHFFSFAPNRENMNIVFKEVQYGADFPIPYEELTKSDSVFILDFSYKRDICEKVASLVKDVTILDHHKTAEQELKGLPYAVFDNTKSGALLAWEYFFPNMIGNPPRACRLVNDRDLWKFEFGDDSRAFEAYLRVNSVGSDWAKWTDLVEDELHMALALKEGRTYLKYECATVANFVKNPRNIHEVNVRVDSTFYKIAVYEGMGVLHSELAEHIYNNTNNDFTLEWRIKEVDKVVFSLRSKVMDVSAIAKAFGGGGHKAAAGFSLDIGKGMALVKELYRYSTDKETYYKLI